MSGFDGVVMWNHSRALVDGRFEQVTAEFVLASFSDVGRDPVPQVGDENDVLQCRIAANFAKDVEIPFGDLAKLIVGDGVDVDEPRKQKPFVISVEKFSPKDRETTNADAHSRGSQKSCNNVQNFRVVTRSVTESRDVDESNSFPIENKLVRELDLGCGVHSDLRIRTTCEIDELEAVE